MEDRVLIRRIKKGDKAAFEELVVKHYENIFAYCFRRTGSRQDAEDLTQEVFLKLVKVVYKYQSTGKFSNFIFTIAVNCCNDFLRRQVRQSEREAAGDASGELTGNVMPVEQGAEEKAMIREDSRVLYRRLAGLNDSQREALILHYFHGFRAREIAAMTGVPLATAKSRIRQGMEHLRRQYTDEGEEEL